MVLLLFIFCKQKTAYVMRISDCSSDVCSSYLGTFQHAGKFIDDDLDLGRIDVLAARDVHVLDAVDDIVIAIGIAAGDIAAFQPAVRREGGFCRGLVVPVTGRDAGAADLRSEEHTSELQSLMRISYAVFCLKKKNKRKECEHN